MSLCVHDTLEWINAWIPHVKLVSHKHTTGVVFRRQASFIDKQFVSVTVTSADKSYHRDNLVTAEYGV